MSQQPFELSLEQQFSIRMVEHQVSRMSQEQAQRFAIDLYRQMLLREVTYQQLIRHKWGMDGNIQA